MKNYKGMNIYFKSILKLTHKYKYKICRICYKVIIISFKFFIEFFVLITILKL